jgi:hypothetical protein
MRVDTAKVVGYIGSEVPVELPAQLDGRPGWRFFPKSLPLGITIEGE